MQVTLVYRLDVGSQSPASQKMLERAANINFNEGTLDYLGVELVGDSTVPEALPNENTKIKRTIVLETNNHGDSMWKTPEMLKYATRNIFKQVFELRMPALVVAEEPVVS